VAPRSRRRHLEGRHLGEGNEPERLKFKDYFQFAEPAHKLPSHRVLALRRGEKEGFLRVDLEVDRPLSLDRLRGLFVKKPRASLAGDFDAALVDAYDRLLAPSIDLDVRLLLKERADAEAIRVFAENMRHLLLASPLGGKRVLALDPGFRSGCKVVVLDGTGRLLAHTVVYPHEPQRQIETARKELAALVARHAIEAVSIGNGTAGRETEVLVRAMKKDGLLPASCLVVSVNESGASVYSASEIAREELPDQDVTVRGAVSIGRRLQDPLAELVKIDPRSIGVGQYQHDVNQALLGKALDAVVESCVNGVGVEVNTASARLLADTLMDHVEDPIARLYAGLDAYLAYVDRHKAAPGSGRGRRRAGEKGGAPALSCRWRDTSRRTPRARYDPSRCSRRHGTESRPPR